MKGTRKGQSQSQFVLSSIQYCLLIFWFIIYWTHVLFVCVCVLVKLLYPHLYFTHQVDFQRSWLAGWFLQRGHRPLPGDQLCGAERTSNELHPLHTSPLFHPPCKEDITTLNYRTLKIGTFIWNWINIYFKFSIQQLTWYGRWLWARSRSPKIEERRGTTKKKNLRKTAGLQLYNQHY